MNYNIEYYEKMLREYSATAEQISKIRWKWVMEVKPRAVLDYGCGCGWFRAWRPRGVEVDSFDIAQYPQTGVKLRIYDVVCFWDVLEHIPDFVMIEPILAIAKYIAVTMPIIPEGQAFETWKHFKPGEHLHYFSQITLEALMRRYGFELLIQGNIECPPRKDVTSFLFKRVSL